jgi:hypothetical protein
MKKFSFLIITTFNKMQTIRIEITGEESLEKLRKLEENKLIRILNEPDVNSYSLPGESISENDFASMDCLCGRITKNYFTGS